MIHPIPEEKLHLINEMDKKIGEFMQKRADVVNTIIRASASLQAGDAVEIYDENSFVSTGVIVQPLFLKRQGIITYRVRTESGEVFTNETYQLRKTETA